MVLVIIVRDTIITMLRSYTLKKKRMMKTVFLAKFKTAFQMFSIITIILILILKDILYMLKIISRDIDFEPSLLVNIADINLSTVLFGMPFILMSLLTLITFISGIHYFIINKNFNKDQLE